MHRLSVLVFLSIFLLISCSTIPLSAMMRMSRFSVEEFVSLIPEDIRAKVVTFRCPPLNENNSKIDFVITKKEGKSDEYNFLLEVVEREAAPAPTSGNKTEETTTFRLTQEGVQSMLQLQQALRTSNLTQYEGFRLSVRTFFKDKPDENASPSMSILLKLKKNEDFFTMVNKAKLPKFKKEEEIQKK